MATKVPPFHGNINFNAQHSPMGAFMSFTCGHFGTRGGFGVQIGQPGNQNVFIGIKHGDRYSKSPMKCLPFYQQVTGASGADAFLVEQPGPAEQHAPVGMTAYRARDIARRYGWGTDQWDTRDISFAIHTPFGAIPDPAKATRRQMRAALLPAVTARLVVDNTRGNKIKTAFFGLTFPDAGIRVLELPRRVGFAHRSGVAFAGQVRDVGGRSAGAPFAFMRWNVARGLGNRDNPVHLLGNTPGIGFEVPPGKCYELSLALGCYLDGVVTTRLPGRYLYTRYFDSIEDVLAAGLDRCHTRAAAAESRDAQLWSSGLSANQQFLIAHATRSYYGSTQLLDVRGKPFWVVNEGEYCMMNTLDLSVDQVFWELKHNPWVVRNLLETFVQYYSYVDEVKIENDAPNSRDARRRAPGGISFCHDMGAHNQFSPFGTSSYELANLNGCFSYMTQEQLCNWILVAACYFNATRDAQWLRRSRRIICDCLSSMLHRGGKSGFAQFDSDRCARGQEITTYDSLDHSLAQARNNVYIATKCWAANVGLATLFAAMHDRHRSAVANAAASKVAMVIAGQARDGVLPAVFEKDNPGFESRILPAVEGLIYPLVWGIDVREKFAPLYHVLRQHTVALLLDPKRRNLFRDGGIRLSSTSNNSWMSKIAIFQHIARRVFGLHRDPKLRAMFERADAAHVKWQTDGSAYWACSDQMVSGVARGSRYYPRIITTALSMDKTPRHAR